MSQSRKQTRTTAELAAAVAIVMGSDSDWEEMAAAARRLADLQVGYKVKVLSAHRSPAQTAAFARRASKAGFRVIIAGAGGAAHLAGVIAAHTTLPVIGVPLDATGLGGLDALLSTVQMPAGIPVATMATGRAGAENAAILAAQILSLQDSRLSQQLAQLKARLARRVEAKNSALQRKLS